MHVQKIKEKYDDDESTSKGHNKKDHIEILEFKSIIIERKNLYELNGKFDTAEARTSEPKDKTVEIIQNENQRGKGLKKNEQRLRDS